MSQNRAVERVSIPDPQADSANADIYVRRRTPTVARLRRSRKIAFRHELAAERLYLSYIVGVEGAIEGAAEQVNVGPVPGWMKAHYSEARIAALTEYRLAIKALGQYADTVVFVAVHDLSLGALAKRIRVRKARILGVVVDALNELADHYDIASDAQPVPEK